MQAHPVSDADGNVIQAINVFRDVTADREADERRRFLLQAVDELNSSLDYESDAGGDRPPGGAGAADWCGVDVVEDGRRETAGDGARRPEQARGGDRDREALSARSELEDRRAGDRAHGQAQLIPEIPRQLLTAAAVDAEHLRLIDELELRSFMGVPLTIGGRVLGAITFVMAESHRTYGPADLEFARSLADRAAIAVENARLFREVEGARASIGAQLARGGAAPARGRGSDAVRGDVRRECSGMTCAIR